MPAFHDPFAGGGALPLEAQRLGLRSYASDLNPVAVLINKAMIEIPPKFAGHAPVNPDIRSQNKLVTESWPGASGLAADVRYYGQWIKDEANRRIGHLYPKIEVTRQMAEERPDLTPYVGTELTVIAWIWARTVASPNPAFSTVHVPLATTFMLSTKPGKEAYVEPVIDAGGYRFVVKAGTPADGDAAKLGTSAGKWNAFRCVMSNTPITYAYIRAEGSAQRLGTRLMAVVAEGVRSRVFLSPTPAIEATTELAQPWWSPELEINYHPRDIKTQIYGLTRYGQLFTPRQLVALDTFSDLVQEARDMIQRDSQSTLCPEAGETELGLSEHASEYANGVATYLAFALSKQADLGNSLCRWEPNAQCPRQLFGRQAMPMIWDFAEGNPLGDSSGAWSVFIRGISNAFAKAFEFVTSEAFGSAQQADAGTQDISHYKVVSTDPPYYDNIGYADLSDFFYVWLRRTLKHVYPELFATVAVPKAQELVATPYRHGSKEAADTFFVEGMTSAMHHLAEHAHPAFPVTLYYAFKQSENDAANGVASTGWDSFLAAVIRAGFAITGTWPVRTENASRMIGQSANALASSIVLVCRKRLPGAPTTTRREFAAELKRELPKAVGHLQQSNIAPVDLAQAAIGPGMGIYTSYSRVLDAAGTPLSVRDALALINQTLDETLIEQEGDFDTDTRWALAWFEQCGFSEGDYGAAETLSKAKNTSVAGMVQAGIIVSGRGAVRLLRPNELPPDWDPSTDTRLTAWESLHHLVRALETSEANAGGLVARLGHRATTVRELCYRLYTLSERKKWSAEALTYNTLVLSWPEITRLALELGKSTPTQVGLFEE
jgi:putative DNA methylase